MGLPLPLDPTPKTIEAIVARLPASERAQLDWFPMLFRRNVVDPLCAADVASFPAVVDEVALEAVRIFLRLARATAALVDLPRFSELVTSCSDPIHERITSRLEPAEPRAADDLREAWAWLRAILLSLLSEFRAEIAASLAAHDEATLSDEDVQRELGASGGAFLRGLLLTVAAAELLRGDQPLPATLGRWCNLASREVQAAANALRAEGVAVPTAVSIPGVSAEEWHARRSSRRLRGGMLPPGVLQTLIDALDPEEVWLFGSRGRGSYAPDSDWDLLVVLPAGADMDSAETSSPLASLRRQRVDLVLVSRDDFEENQASFGTLVNVVVTQGYRVYAR